MSTRTKASAEHEYGARAQKTRAPPATARDGVCSFDLCDYARINRAKGKPDQTTMLCPQHAGSPVAVPEPAPGSLRVRYRRARLAAAWKIRNGDGRTALPHGWSTFHVEQDRIVPARGGLVKLELV